MWAEDGLRAVVLEFFLLTFSYKQSRHFPKLEDACNFCAVSVDMRRSLSECRMPLDSFCWPSAGTALIWAAERKQESHSFMPSSSCGSWKQNSLGKVKVDHLPNV